MQSDKPQPRCLTVLGMHRSGTSMLMGTLRDAGLHVGAVLGDCIEGNPKGLQEAPAVLYMQEDLLEKNGGSWSDPPASVEWHELHRTVRDLFIESRAGQSLWGFKDPRTLLTLEGWLDVLPQLESVGIFRHPLPVARSLRQRDAFPIAKGLAIWQHYNRRLLELHQQRSFPLIEFQADPLQMEKKLGGVLEELHLPDRHRALRAGFFDARVPNWDPLEEPLPRECADLYAALRQIAGERHPQPSAQPAPATSKQPGSEYCLRDLAARCDWVIRAASQPPHLELHRRNGDAPPRHVYLPLSERFAALEFFCSNVMPRIEEPFRLVSGLGDRSVAPPHDGHRRQLHASQRDAIDQLLNDPRLICWAAQSLDIPNHPKRMPVPQGLTPDWIVRSHPIPAAQSCRPLRLLCAHRLGEGPRWEERRQVSELCRSELHAWSSVITEPRPPQQIVRLLEHHAFALCVPGGGTDASPMVWLALLHGTIPIIRSSAMDPVFRDLPVLLIREWRAEELQPERLLRCQEQWIRQIEPPKQRAQMLRQLTVDTWWQRIIRFEPDTAGTERFTPAIEAPLTSENGTIEND